MSNHLRSCEQCARHVRVSETTCPFCKAEVPRERMSPERLGKPTGHRDRLLALTALAAAGAIGGVAAVSCSNNPTWPPTVVSAYGVAQFGEEPDAGVDAHHDARADAGTAPDADAAPGDASDSGDSG
jgi:hypothetical protein